MKKLLFWLFSAILSSGTAFAQLVPVTFDALSDKGAFDRDIWSRKADIKRGIADNMAFLSTSAAHGAYARLNVPGLNAAVMSKSLLRFRDLLDRSRSSEEFRTKLLEEFALFRSVGNDGRGTVKFTGYFQPTYKASRTRTSEYRYPIYRIPPGYELWQKPHPSRVTLEGYDGTGNPKSPIWGQELAFFKTRYEAFMVHVQGSAILELTDGSQMAVGFAAGTEYPFRGVPKSFLVQKRILWTSLPSYFTNNPADLNWILSRNNRFILFKENANPLPIGSLGAPVIAERSIATDKLRLPPGALGLIRTKMPTKTASGGMKMELASRFVLDQDTGSAIKGPGRVDIFMGTGPEGQHKANSIFSNGELYYLVLKTEASRDTRLPRS